MKKMITITFVVMLFFSFLSYAQPVELDIIWEAQVNAPALKFTPDGSLLISGGNNTEINCYPYTCGQLKVWDVADTSLVVSVGTFNMGLINDLDISSDGQRFISGNGSVYCSAFTGCSRDRAGQFEFTINGSQNYANTNPDGIIYSIAFSPDNSIIAAGTGYNNSGHINIYDSQYNLLRTLLGHSSRTTSLVFTADGQYLISGGYDGYIRVWNYNTGNIVTYFQHGTYTNGGTDLRLSISSDGQYLASSGDGYNVAVKIWKISDWSLIHTFTIESEYGADGLVKFTPNSLYLAAGFSRYVSGGLGWYGLLNFYDVETGQLVREYIDLQGSPTNGGVRSIAFSTIGNNYFAYGVSSHNNSRLRLAATDLDLVEDNIVPVELASFNANVNHNKITLNWITSSELNNSGFEIEKQEGSQQSPVGKWERIGFVEGKGTTSETNNYSFEDKNLSSGIYKYRLKQVDFNGTFEYSNVIEVETNIPDEFSLLQNYPNPFNPTTRIKYSVSSNGKREMSKVSLKVFDVLGNEAAVLVDGYQSPGEYEFEFNANTLSSGIYFYRLQTTDFSETKKMVLLK